MAEFDRRRRLRALCLGDKAMLGKGLDELGDLPELSTIKLLKGPEAGLVMVQGRVGGDGPPFNLGELLVTRCAVRVGQNVGHGFSAGDDPEGATLAAMADALALDPSRTGAINSLALMLELDLEAKDAIEIAKTAATKVEFLTLARGGDDD